MKYIKIITLSFLLLTSGFVCAEIEFRTATPNFSIEKVKHNRRINRATDNPHITKGNRVSYLSIGESQPSVCRQTVVGNSTSYYRQYNSVSTENHRVSYNSHITMKSYNVANRMPFDGGEAMAISTANRQNAFGPPAEGPIGDVVWPLLLFVGIYLLRLRKVD